MTLHSYHNMHYVCRKSPTKSHKNHINVEAMSLNNYRVDSLNMKSNASFSTRLKSISIYTLLSHL